MSQPLPSLDRSSSKSDASTSLQTLGEVESTRIES
jgi:hypothetical protein